MVDHLNLEDRTRRLNLASDREILEAGRRISRRMIMREDNRGGISFADAAGEDRSNRDVQVGEAAAGDLLHAEQALPDVEMQDDKTFDREGVEDRPDDLERVAGCFQLAVGPRRAGGVRPVFDAEFAEAKRFHHPCPFRCFGGG